VRAKFPITCFMTGLSFWKGQKRLGRLRFADSALEPDSGSIWLPGGVKGRLGVSEVLAAFVTSLEGALKSYLDRPTPALGLNRVCSRVRRARARPQRSLCFYVKT
jgi:hypothetical protein